MAGIIDIQGVSYNKFSNTYYSLCNLDIHTHISFVVLGEKVTKEKTIGIIFFAIGLVMLLFLFLSAIMPYMPEVKLPEVPEKCEEVFEPTEPLQCGDAELSDLEVVWDTRYEVEDSWGGGTNVAFSLLSKGNIGAKDVSVKIFVVPTELRKNQISCGCRGSIYEVKIYPNGTMVPGLIHNDTNNRRVYIGDMSPGAESKIIGIGKVCGVADYEYNYTLFVFSVDECLFSKTISLYTHYVS